MQDDALRDLRRIAFYKNKDGSPATDEKGDPLLDQLGMPARRQFSPIWTMTEQANGTKVDGCILSRYRDAAISLARSGHFKKTWDADHDGARFLLVRDEWIRACEAARTHDWAADKREHERRKSLDADAAAIGKAARKFREVLVTDKQGAAQKLAQFLDAAFENRTLSDDEVHKMTSAVPACAVLGALDRFAEHCETPTGRGRGPVCFGPLRILRFPLRLPAREIALAVQLADLFSRWRAGTTQTWLHSGREPALSNGTPWSAVARFVDGAFGNTEQTINLAKKVPGFCKNEIRIVHLSDRDE